MVCWSLLISIGVFAYTASDAIPSVNCTQSVQFQSGVEFPVQLQLILTGIVLIAMDVGISLLLFAIKKLSCGTVAIVWFLTSTLLVTVWGGWSIAYAVLVYPLWNADRDSCDELVMISMLVGVALVATFMLLYWIIALVTMVYDCWYRCDLECECSCRRRRNEFGDF